eukprot:2496711-Prymnesium_polylepis.1
MHTARHNAPWTVPCQRHNAAHMPQQSGWLLGKATGRCCFCCVCLFVGGREGRDECCTIAGPLSISMWEVGRCT